MITDYRYSHTTYSNLKKEDLCEYDCPNPTCGARRSTKYYSHYERHVISLTADVLSAILDVDTQQTGIDLQALCDTSSELYKDTILDIYRVKCQSCDTTHAILPGDVVPYRQYGLFTMLAVVKVMYHRECSIEKIAEHLQLSWQYMLGLLKQWISHLHAVALIMRAVYQEFINEQATGARVRILSFVCEHRFNFPREYQKEHRNIIFMIHGQNHRGRKIMLGMAMG